MSPDDLGFDPFDDRLGHELRAVAPTAPSGQRTLDELRPRLTRARQLRRTAMAGAWSLAGAGALALGLVVVGSGGTSRIDTPPASRSDRGVTTTTLAPTTTSTVPGTTPGTLDDDGGNRGPGGDDDSGSGSSGSSGSGSGSSGSGSGSGDD